MTQVQANAAQAMVKLCKAWAQGMRGPEKMSRQSKLVAERNELSGKIKRLKVFMKTDTFKRLDKDDQMIMKGQKDAMKMYKRALDLRLYWGIY